jgi:trichothecene 3-O-acetyltransferase
MPVSYNRVFLAFTCASATHASAIAALKNGLQVTCSQLPYLKGRVYNAGQQGGRLGISWSEQHDPTPPFQEIEYPTDSEMPSYAQLKRDGLASHRLPQSLCPVMGFVAASFPDGNAPVIAASYTRLDGGVLVCLCVHHNVMDGTGTGMVISLWGRNTKGVPSEPLPDSEEPRHRLERLKASRVGHDSASMDDKGLTVESMLALHPEYTSVITSRRPPFPPCTSRIFTFPVEKLKTAAIESKTSVNNVLCAIIWSCISSARSNRWRNEIGASNEEALHTELKLGMAVNGRARLGESFAGAGGRPYIGNVNLYSVTNLGLDHLVKLGQSPGPEANWAASDTLASVVPAITASIGRINRQFISEVITIAEQVPSIQSLQPGWNFFNGPDLTITSWANLDTYSVDFGPELGMPDFVRLPYLEVDGLNIVLPRRRTSIPENIEVVIMLRKDDMAEVERNEMWRYWTQAPNLTK